MCSLINVSNNLHTTDVKLIGLSFSDLFLDTFLNNGVMFASFHSEGTISSSSDKLYTFCMWCTNFLYTFLKQFWWYPINSR